MITQQTKSVMKIAMLSVLTSAGVKATFSVYQDMLVLKIKKSNTKIDFIANYNENYRSARKVSSILSIESFNKQWFTGEAKKVVDALFSIAKSYGSKLIIEVSGI